jgi:hypothetical protein
MNPHRPSRRSGIALALGLLVLGLTVLIFGALLQRVRHSRDLHLSHLRALQSSWLAESGLERAWSRLAEDPSYHGETWLVPAASLNSVHNARVKITVEPVPDRPSLLRVTAQADYPDNRWTRVRRSRSAILEPDRPKTEKE